MMSVQINKINKNKIFNRTNVLFWGGLIFAVVQLMLPIFKINICRINLFIVSLIDVRK